MLRFIRFFAFALSFMAATATAEPVRVDGGNVVGKSWNGTLLFRGIPFAAPPVGALRWRPPQPVVPWAAARGPVEQPSSCPQNDYGWNHADFLIGNEDCLTLDVRTPGLTGRRPVLVWIHGGSNRAGGPNDIVLSDIGNSVVLVGIRYRLGIFGFLSHRKLTAEQGASGNYGIMDQLAALRWVQRNIAHFGGDPRKVTIAGESAGSEDVGLLYVAPSARTLFKRAIMESGTPGFGMSVRSLRNGERLGDAADALLGTSGNLAKMRNTSASALLEADRKLHDPTQPGEPDDFIWLTTTVDGSVLRRTPDALLRDAPPKPIIIGTNRVEFGVSGSGNREQFMRAVFGGNAAKARAFYESEKAHGRSPRLGSPDDEISTDAIFRCPVRRFAKVLADKGAVVWNYEFDAAQNGGLTAHAAEIPYAFGKSTFGGLSLAPYWLNFVRSGDPNGRGLPIWPRFTSSSQAHVLFSSAGVTPLGALRPVICSMAERS